MPWAKRGAAGLQAAVFALVASAITSVYMTQPTLPLLSREFGASAPQASMTVSMVILGVCLASLPFGVLADRWPVKPIIGLGGVLVAACLVAGAMSPSLGFLVGARFVQGLFVPALTSCLAAYLARSLPPQRLGVAMGAYVSATVVGGLSSRLLPGIVLGGDWRLSLAAGAGLVLVFTLAALFWLPAESPRPRRRPSDLSYKGLLTAWPTLAPYLATFGSMFAFGGVFNYVTYHLAAPPYLASTAFISLMYLTYLIGVIEGPLVGRLVRRIGAGPTLTLGALAFMASQAVCLLPSLTGVVLGLCLVCAGHFIIHAGSQGMLNTRLAGSQGRANSLYVLVYYLGGWAGITAAGQGWLWAGWTGVIVFNLVVLLLPLMVGLVEIKKGA
ncbi:MAG: MFS transporter [Desulfarculaceae bacterium]|nr:MFS transporter [Desulfarculaceae bacterium]MCF8071606.1 MFS transporter [Desulfarculaceae bacterium]MCF8103197.1 MFS transporter [Desulfarculaceae bacterium]MCF8114885.1 MFS transporter [Desulfarculaceae bacterium]